MHGERRLEHAVPCLYAVIPTLGFPAAFTSIAPVKLDTFATSWLLHHVSIPLASRSAARGSA